MLTKWLFRRNFINLEYMNKQIFKVDNDVNGYTTQYNNTEIKWVCSFMYNEILPMA